MNRRLPLQRWLRPRLLVVGLLAALIVACSGPAPLPDFRYYRLSPATTATAFEQAPLQAPLVVNGVQADGVHGERPILYATDPDSLRISQYHYQVWNDPPPSLIQRRALQLFDARNLAPLVTNRLDPRIEAYRVSIRLNRFEVIRVGGSNREVVAGMRIRADFDGSRLPLMEKQYTLRRPAQGQSLTDGTAELSVAVDEILLSFVDDLVAAVAEGQKAE